MKFRIGEIALYWDGHTREVLSHRKKWLPVRVISVPVPDAGWGYGVEGLYGTADVDAKAGELRHIRRAR